MYKVTKYANAESSSVKETIEFEKVFEIIKNGDSAKTHIEYARNFKKGTEEYDNIKTKLIPTFRFNFLFIKKASNKNIVSPTGLIYIDVDDINETPESDFIFAKWKSLSLTGYCILVKVNNLSLDNFSNSYSSISKLLNVDSDTGARKATQQTIQSFDPDIYINKESKVFECVEVEKVSSPIKQKGEEKGLTTNSTFSKEYPRIKIRYNNIDEYFKDNDSEYIVFKDKKEKLCIPFVPKKVVKGSRNQCLFIFLSQIVALNPEIHKAYAKATANSININVMEPQLSDDEIDKIVHNIFVLKESNKLFLNKNKERRIIFNPSFKKTFEEKMKIVNRVLGELKSESTTELIYECIEQWDFESYGKITQSKVASLTGKSLSTIKKYWFNFKFYVKELNIDNNMMSDRIEQIECCINNRNLFIDEPILKLSA